MTMNKKTYCTFSGRWGHCICAPGGSRGCRRSVVEWKRGRSFGTLRPPSLESRHLSRQPEVRFWDDHSSVALRRPRASVRGQLCQVISVTVR